jgi:uncharacterized membrane protein
METLFSCSLWGDEAFSAVLAQKGFIHMLQVVAKDTSPPLFYIIMFIWFRIFGSSEVAIRSLSFLFYLGTVWIIYLISRELFSKKEAVWAAALTFFNPFLFLYAFEGRMYFTLLFFVSLSYYFFIKKRKLGHILSSAAALCSHHFAIFAIFTQFIYASAELVTQKKQARWNQFWNLIKHYSLIGVLYIPWLYPFYLQTKLVAGGFWLGKPQLKAISDTFFNFIKGDQIVFSIQKRLPILTLLLLAARKWQKKNRKKDILLILWTVTPILATWLISQTKLSIFYERYLLYSVPPLMLLLASRTRKIALPIKGVILIIFILVCLQLFTHPYKRPFRKLANFAKAYLNTEDYFLINYNGHAHHLWEAKYYQLNAPLYVPNGQLPFYVGTAQMTPNDIVKKLPVDKTIVAITSNNPKDVKIKGWQAEKFENFDSSLYLVFFQKAK